MRYHFDSYTEPTHIKCLKQRYFYIVFDVLCGEIFSFSIYFTRFLGQIAVHNQKQIRTQLRKIRLSFYFVKWSELVSRTMLDFNEL